MISVTQDVILAADSAAVSLQLERDAQITAITEVNADHEAQRMLAKHDDSERKMAKQIELGIYGVDVWDWTPEQTESYFTWIDAGKPSDK